MVMHIPYMEEYQNNMVSQIFGKTSRMCKQLKPGILSTRPWTSGMRLVVLCTCTVVMWPHIQYSIWSCDSLYSMLCTSCWEHCHKCCFHMIRFIISLVHVLPSPTFSFVLLLLLLLRWSNGVVWSSRGSCHFLCKDAGPWLYYERCIL